MAVQEVEPDGDLWFFADAASHAVTHVVAEPQVNEAEVTGKPCSGGENETVDL